MPHISFVGESADASIETVDRPYGAVQLAVSNHGHVMEVSRIVLPETCALIVNLTADSAVEGLKKGHVKWLQFTRNLQLSFASTLRLAEQIIVYYLP